MLHYDRTGVVVFVTLTLLTWSIGTSDETHTRYFEQLRQRRLFALAEAEAISRLVADNLSLAAKTEFTIEYSRTLTEHAGFVADEQRSELWQRARHVIQTLIQQDQTNPRLILLDGQLASVSVSEGDWLTGEHSLRPFDELLSKGARDACIKAIKNLQAIEKSLVEPSSNSGVKKRQSGGPSGFELRALLHQARWQIGQSYCNLAEMDALDSAERLSNIVNAEQSLRKLTGVADEPVQSRARILLAACSRLKGELDRASEMLIALGKNDPRPIDAVLDELTAEQVRLLMDLQRPTDAVELLMKTRSKRQRLSGELWFLQTRALIAVRDLTLVKQQDGLSDGLSEQITTAIERCEQQVGGYWSRRCRQLWDNAQTSRKYGPELDSLMQQARMNFTAGRIDTALADYASAENAAKKADQSDLAMELGFTRASILLDQKRNEKAATEFFRLANDYSRHERTANAHLLGAYALGRYYDEKKTQQRREAYATALDRHLNDYSQDATVNEARFLKAQMEEQRLQATQALPLYLEIEPGHPRASDAISGAARCYETILRRMIERHLSTDQVEHEAIDRLTKYLSINGDAVEKWTDTHADVALRLVSILLMDTSASHRPDDRVHAEESGPDDLAIPTNADRFKQSTVWLRRLTAYLDRRSGEPDSASIVSTLQQRAVPLQILTLTESGNIAEAERRLKSLAASPAVLFSVIETLDRFVSAKQHQDRYKIAAFQLKAALLLLPHKEQLSAIQRSRLEQSIAVAYAATGQSAKAIEIVKGLADAAPEDADKQRELARLLAEMKDPEAYFIAKQCWRRVESRTKPGSAEWLVARLEVLGTYVQLKQFEEGRKLLQVTKVLYPDLGGNPLSVKFEAIERLLRSPR